MSYLNISVSADLSPREDQTKFSDALSAWTRETSPSSPGPSPAVAWTCPWLWLWARNCKLVTLLAHQLSTGLSHRSAPVIIISLFSHRISHHNLIHISQHFPLSPSSHHSNIIIALLCPSRQFSAVRKSLSMSYFNVFPISVWLSVWLNFHWLYVLESW